MFSNTIILSPHREGRVQATLLAGQCLTGIIKSAAAEAADADDHDDAALRYDQRSVRAGRPSAQPVRPGNIVMTLNLNQ